jgi:ribonucleotide reductase alpha subunit
MSATVSDNARSILKERYLTNGEDVEGMWDRVSGGNPVYRSLMSELLFLPNSPTLFNMGTKYGGTLSACFTADTVIHTLGGDFTVAELLESGKTSFKVFSTDGKRLKVGNAFNLRRTRSGAKVYRVTYDTGQSIKVTSDHLIMMRDGSYKPAGKLKKGESVMPFNYEYKGKYRIVWQTIDRHPIAAYKWSFVQANGRWAKKGLCIHHKDFNASNDEPTNLQEMTEAEHSRIHMLKKNPMHDPAVAAKISRHMLGNKRGVGPKPGVARAMVGNKHAAGAKWTEERKQAQRERMMGNRLRRGRRMSVASRKRMSDAHLKRLYNHKVVSVEYAGREDVYDLSVHKYHNFAANGVFVHNCFVFDIADTLLGDWPEGGLADAYPDSILGTTMKAACVAKAGGGVGYYLGNIRPFGSPVHSTHKKACGPVQVLHWLHELRSLITQGGKRDLAQMGVLPVWHADIRRFIHCKDFNPKELESFNISVSWTDEYLKKIDWDHLESDSHFDTPTGLWWEQCQAAWKTGDPGMFFFDIVNRANATPHLGQINAPNPCFTGDTRVWTIYGPRRFDELVGSEVPVLSETPGGQLVFKMMRDIRLTHRRAKVYRVVTRAQRIKNVYGEFKATGDHLVFLRDGTQKKIKDLVPGDRLASAYRRKANQKGYLRLVSTSGDEDMEHKVVMSYTCGHRPEYPAYHVHHKDDDKRNNHPDNLEVMAGAEHDARKMRGANNPMNRFPEKNPFRQPGFRQKYTPSGFRGRRHSEESKRKIRESCRRNNHEVVRVEYVGREDVYDGTVDDTHRFFIYTEKDGGVLVHNCGETPNLSDEPCNLGSLALLRFVKERGSQSGMWGNGPYTVDWDKIKHHAREATRFMDDILDWNRFPHPDITKMALATRKLGLGVMGWADMLALLRIPYDCQDAVDLGEEVMKQTNQSARLESIELGKTKGLYPAYDPTASPDWAPAARNSTRTSVAPTGTIAIIAGCNASIEPYPYLQWTRTTNEGLKFHESITVRDRIGDHKPKIAAEIGLEWHVRHQAAFQRHTDLGVSKTINLPQSATPRDISAAYRMMWETKCKGGTVYRNNCRNEQVLVDASARSVYATGAGYAKLPDDVPCLPRHKFKIGKTKGYLHVGVTEDFSRPVEIFLRFSKGGSTIQGLVDTWAIAFSNALQRGAPLDQLVELHAGTRFEPCGLTSNPKLRACSSIPDYVVRYLELKFLKKPDGGPELKPLAPAERGTVAAAFRGLGDATRNLATALGPGNGEQMSGGPHSGQICPDCNAELIFQAGCLMCPAPGCGYNRCGS